MIVPVSYMFISLASLATSHMVMKTPKPFSATKYAYDNGPLKDDGSDYPCKFPYNPEGANNEMPLGSTQQLSFTGSAVHGGGSCQISLAYDPAPSANTTFKVIHSIMGGCPARNANGNSGGPDVYNFKIPENLPSGNAVLAWTWFNKVGNREMYMDCAPVKITSGSYKRDIDGGKPPATNAASGFDALPDMMVANIGNGCSTTEGTDVQFANPGDSVEIVSHDHLAAPVGNCGGSSHGGYKSAAGPSDSAKSHPAPEPATEPAPQRASDETDAEPKKVSSSSDNSQSAPTSQQASTPGAFFDVSPSQNSDHANDKPKEAPHEDVPPTTASTNSTVSTNSKVGSVCTPEGAWNCLEGKSYQRCASGTWSAIMPMAEGTTCKDGKSSILVEHATARSIHFPRSHLRRHQLGSIRK